MSNYSKTTDFASKDALATGNANKIVKGTEIDDEFSAIQTAIATKANTLSPTLTGTPLAPTAAADTNTTQIATTAFSTAAATAAIQALHPVGSIYTNATNSTNPATLFGFGTWEEFGAGRVMVGFDAGNTLFDAAEETGGSADSIVPSHTHSITDPGHTHTYDDNEVRYTRDDGISNAATVNIEERTTNSSVTGITIDSEGVSATDTNYQPYITVYMWKRTA